MQLTEETHRGNLSGQLRQAIAGTVALFVVTCTLSLVGAQEPGQQEPIPGERDLVQLSFPPQTELAIVIDFVSQRLGVQILYDEQVANKSITLKSPQPIPADTLLDVLESALKMKGLALVDAEVEGWKRITVADELAQIATPKNDEPIEDFPGTVPVTQTFRLRYVTPDRVGQFIEPFLTKQGANVTRLPDQNLLIVTDYADNLRRIARLVETIDQSGPERMLELYQVNFVNATELAQQLSQSLASLGGPEQAGILRLNISHDKRTNQLLLAGTREQLDGALELARILDVALDQRTEVYSFQYVDAERIDRLVKEIVGPLTSERFYRSAVDRDDNLLIATGTEPIHKQIVQLRAQMDVETQRLGSSVKFYRLKYADAQEVLNTLRAVEQQTGTRSANDYQRGVSALGRGENPSGGPRQSPIDFVPGPNTPEQPGEPSPQPPALREELPGAAPSEPTNPAQSGALQTIVPGAARVSVDPNSNAIIVVAERAVQQVYEELIRSLDRRRPQVMIEAKVVILDTSDSFALGVEYSTGDRAGNRRNLNFSSFGLSSVDAISGALALIPGMGFNYTLVDPDLADAVVRAMASHSRAKVVSSPRILVNDNATGTLASVTEVPFTSINASTTVATTSFAGFAEAGTTIEVTPRITDNDHLYLDFNIALNSFTGTGGDGIPPPRQTDQITSSVTVPDGYTVIVGGLNRTNHAKTRDSIPFVENIPILRFLSGIETKSNSQTTVFVFLRPIILRDDKFRDLKYLSDRDLPRAKEPGNYAAARPLLIE